MNMKKLIVVFTLCLSVTIHSQSSEHEAVKATIEAFFEAFHKQDSTKLKAMVTKNMVLQSISTNASSGEVTLTQSGFSQLVNNIVSIPKDRTFEEKLLDFKIRVDGEMANAWTPYEFWYNGNFSHCGVNSFQLIQMKNEWKIFYLVDTRRREGCHE